MSTMFAQFTQVIGEGILPCMIKLIDWFLNEGFYFGLLVIFLPFLRRLIILFRKLI